MVESMIRYSAIHIGMFWRRFAHDHGQTAAPTRGR
jgi:hypothetical protein